MTAFLTSCALFAQDPRTISPEFPYASKYARINGSSMHYVESGTGDPILLVHGNPTNVYIWRNIIPHLTPYGRVIAVDLIGFGKSGKPDIEYRFADHAAFFEAFIAELGLKRITFVLHDWGSALGFDYAARHPQNVRALAFFEALLAPLPDFDQWPNPTSAETFRRYRTPELGWSLIGDQNEFVEKRLQEGILRRLSAAELDHYREPFRDPKTRKPVWRWPNELPVAGQPADVATVQNNYLRWLSSTLTPKLLLYARPGALTPEPIVDWCKKNLPALQTVDVGPGVHNLQEDRPHEIGTAIQRWLASLGLNQRER